MRRTLALVVLALFVSSVEFVAAADALGAHEDSASACTDSSRHFCAEKSEHDPAKCVICHVSALGWGWVEIGQVETISVVRSEALPAISIGHDALEFSSASPRGPPSL